MSICAKCKKEHDGNFGSGIYCSRSCANSRVKSAALRQQLSRKIKKRIKTSGLWGCLAQRSNIEKKPKICPVCNKIFYTLPSQCKRIYCSKKCYIQDNNCLYRKSPAGGYRRGSGRGKGGYYKGFWCDSTYELTYLIYCLDHNISIQRNKEKFEYVWNNKKLAYYPDFIVNNLITEVKGYYTPQVDAKIAAVNKPIQILYKDALEPMFRYVINTYKKPKDRLYELYDNHRPEYEYICNYCNKTFLTNRKRSTVFKFCSQHCAGLERKRIKLISH